MADCQYLHTGRSRQFFKIFSNGNCSIQCLIEYLLVIFEVCLFNFPIPVNKMVEHVYRLDYHGPPKLLDVKVFNGFNYLVIEGIFHGCIVFKDSVCFANCLIGLLELSYSGSCSNIWGWTRIFQVLPWCSHLHLKYRASFVIRKTWPCFLLLRVVRNLAALAYNAWIISLKDSYSGSPLIVGRVLKTNWAITLSIISCFEIFSIILLLFMKFLLVLSFLDGIFGYNDVLWFWGSLLRRRFCPVISEYIAFWYKIFF